MKKNILWLTVSLFLFSSFVSFWVVGDTFVTWFDDTFGDESQERQLELANTLTTSLEETKESNPEKGEIIDEIVWALESHTQTLITAEKWAEEQAMIDQGRSLMTQELEEPIILDINWIDLSRVRQYWQDLINNMRANKWLEPYTYDERLDATAQERANTINQRRWSSRVNASAHYRYSPREIVNWYNYWIINTWFRDRGIVATKVSRATHTENIWYRWFRCYEWDCSWAAERWLKNTFDYFMSEGSNWPHFKTLTQKHFRVMWIWFSVSPDKSRLWVVMHYATAIE